MTKRWAVVAACVMGLSAFRAIAFDFGPAVSMGLNYSAEALLVGDVNGDQLDDLVMATAASSSDPSVFRTARIYLQDSSGALKAPLSFHYGDVDGGIEIALSDVNGDHVNDIVLCHGGGVTFLLADGIGNFMQRLVSSGRCEGIGMVDIDMDGRMDAVVSTFDKATFHYGDGHGGIRSSREISTPVGGKGGILIGDVTGDGLDDMILAPYWSSTIYVYSHLPGGGFSAAKTYGKPDVSANAPLVIGDFTGDGRQDLAGATARNGSDAKIWVLPQNSSGEFATAQVFPAYEIPNRLYSTDLDRDGVTDLMVEHSGWSTLGRLMGPVTSSTEVLTAVPAYGFLPAAGDINDDGCTDAILSGVYMLMGRDCQARMVRSDFDNDGLSDLLWRNSSTGANVIWHGANASSQQTVLQVSNLAWGVAGVGDFDGDGRADILWHNVRDGSSVIWKSGSASKQQSMTRVTNVAWKIVGVGDFDADGRADVLWRNGSTGANVIWKSARATAQMTVATVANSRWSVVGVDDFDSDGRGDILWHNSQTGANSVWPAANASRGRALQTVTNLDWSIAGTGDFDGDGEADVLWCNPVTGANVIWRSGNSSEFMSLATVTGHWEVAAVADFNGNGKADIVWRQSDTGQNVGWRAGQRSVQFPVTDVRNLAWSIVP